MPFTPEIGIVLGTLVVAMVLFITEILRMDLVALLVLSTLSLTGLVSPKAALEGFGNPAVITVWAMFILSGALTATGVANAIGGRVLKLAGKSELRMILAIMLTAASLSIFMNNIGVVALLLPVVMDIAKKSGRPPSKLLIPLAYGTLLGGTATLLTTPNLLASEALSARGLDPFHILDFFSVGGFAALGGVLFVALIGRFFLPSKDPVKDRSLAMPDLRDQYLLRERMIVMHVPEGSVNVGKNLLETSLGSAAGLTVYAVMSKGKTLLAPDPQTKLRAGDRLLVGGKLDRFHELRGWREFVLESETPDAPYRIPDQVLGEVLIAEGSSLHGISLVECDFRRRYGTNVLAIRRGKEVMRANLGTASLQAGDHLLVQSGGPIQQGIPSMPEFATFQPLARERARELYKLKDWTFFVEVPENSVLVDKTLEESRLGDAFGLQALSILRKDATLLAPDPHEVLKGGDWLFVKGKRESLEVLRGLKELEIEREATPYLGVLEASPGGMVEAVLSPRSSLTGKTLREINFRKKFGLQVMAIWREGESLQTNLRDLPLRFGDALLLLGPAAKYRDLAKDPDFLVLTQTFQGELRTRKRWLAALIMAGVLTPVLAGWLPVALSAVIGVALMVLTGCLTMDEAYRSIEWRPIFLIAGMLPLGTAIQESGTAQYLASHMVAIAGHYGPWAVVISLFLITSLTVTVVPSAALVVLMGPIVVNTSHQMGLSPHALMMAVAVAAAASFSSPVSHPANLLVMGPGGYRFVDYLKVGLPLTLLVMALVLVVLPFYFPFFE